jgi:alkaline phosphatase
LKTVKIIKMILRNFKNYFLYFFLLLLVLYPNNIFSQGINKLPKNVILMIGDGMGFNHVNASSLYQYGEVDKQVYEKFPVKLAVSTYPIIERKISSGSNSSKVYDTIVYNPDSAWLSMEYLKRNTTESAGAATAFATGRKTYNKAINYGINNDRLYSISERAKEIGKSVGILTSVPFCHATPACFGAHNRNRNNYSEIAKEMLLDSKVDVLMGCGNPEYDDDGHSVKMNYNYIGDSIIWMSILKSETKFGDKTIQDIDGDGIPDPWTLIQSKKEFISLESDRTPPKRVLGIPMVQSTLQQKRYGDAKADPFIVPFDKNVPALKEMTKAALNILKRNPNGFFVMIEGGAIDWASHENQSGRLIEEMIDFNNSIEAVIEWISRNSSWDETCLIVVADHETGLLWGPESDKPPFFKPLVNNGKNKLPGMKWFTTGHSNSLIPLYARGCGSENFENYAKRRDPIHGEYIDNTDVGKVLFEIIK